MFEDDAVSVFNVQGLHPSSVPLGIQVAELD